MEIMTTDGGPHPPEAWAGVTARQIIEIGSTSPQALLSEAAGFQKAITDILTRHHAAVQDHERTALKTDASHATGAIDPTLHLDDAVNAIVDAAQATSFKDHFNRPMIRDYLYQLLGSHFASSINVERLWHGS